MTRTFSQYAVFVVLVAAATLALWGLRNTMHAQEGNAATTSPPRSRPDDPEQLGRALHAYAEEHGKFPPAARYSADGKPLLSWRVLILPYLGEDAKKLYAQFHLDEPWNSPANLPLVSAMPLAFGTATAGSATGGPTAGISYWQAVTGKDTIFADSKGTPFSDIHDGLSNTILLVESNMHAPWTMPYDVSFDSLSPLLEHPGLDRQPRVFRVLLADGTLRWVPGGFPLEKLKELLTRSGHENPDVSTLMQQVGAAGAAAQPSRPSLEQEVRKEFDSRQESLREQIKDFSQRLDRLRVLVDERDQNKDKIIQRRVDELRNPNQRWEAGDQAASGTDRPQRRVVKSNRQANQEMAVFRLSNTKAGTLSETLSTLFYNATSGSVQFSIDASTNSLTVTAAPDDIANIRAAIYRLDVSPGDKDAAATEIDGIWEAIEPTTLDEGIGSEPRHRLVFHKNVHGKFQGDKLDTVGTLAVHTNAMPKRFVITGDRPIGCVYKLDGDKLEVKLIQRGATYASLFSDGFAQYRRVSTTVPQETLDAITHRLRDGKSTKQEIPTAVRALPDASLLRAVDELRQDLWSAKAMAEHHQKMADSWLAETRKVTPDASEQDLQKFDKPRWDRWQESKQHLDSVREQLDMELKTIDSSVEECRADLEEEKRKLAEMERVFAPGKRLSDQQSTVENAELRLKHTITLRALYHNLSEHSPASISAVPSDVALPSVREMEDDVQQKFGLRLDPEIRRVAGQETEHKGLLVAEVQNDSRAALAGLKAGDIILSAHDWTTSSPGNLWFALSYCETTLSDHRNTDIQLLVWRDGDYATVRLSPIKQDKNASPHPGNRPVESATNPNGVQYQMSLQSRSNGRSYGVAGIPTIRSTDELQADVMWALSCVAETRKAYDDALARSQELNPGSEYAGVDKSTSDACDAAIRRVKMLRDEIAAQIKQVDVTAEECSQALAAEYDRLKRMEKSGSSEVNFLDQKKRFESLAARTKKIEATREHYVKLGDLLTNGDASNGVPLPEVPNLQGELLSTVGFDVRPATVPLDERESLLVTEVRSDSIAAEGGLKSGDIIVGAHAWRTLTVSDLLWAMRQVREEHNNPLQLWIWRDREFLILHLAKLPQNK